MCAARLDDVILFFIRDRGDEPLSYAASRGLGGPSGPVGPGKPSKFKSVQVVQLDQHEITKLRREEWPKRAQVSAPICARSPSGIAALRHERALTRAGLAFGADHFKVL